VTNQVQLVCLFVCLLACLLYMTNRMYEKKTMTKNKEINNVWYVTKGCMRRLITANTDMFPENKNKLKQKAEMLKRRLKLVIDSAVTILSGKQLQVWTARLIRKFASRTDVKLIGASCDVNEYYKKE
jgi:hypothetical protein